MPSDSQSKSSVGRCSSCGEASQPGHVCKNPAQGLVGKTFDGRYLVKKILGQGGMGVVFQATQTSMNRDVAVKMLHPTLATSPQFAERFRREAEVVSRLKHPNIISIFDFGQAPDGAFYYTMELLEGENLKSMVKRDGPMTLRRAVGLIEQIGEALAYAHSEGILHRDMKPHNVMCARFHGRDHVKVLDFGLVKMVDEDQGEEHLTTTGQILGTPAYMSPEQAAGDQLDARSDLYSLGVVLYYLLAGSTPFKANSAQKLLQLAMTQDLPPVASRRQGAPIPAALEAFFPRVLAFDRDERPADVDAFIAELHATLEGVSDAVLDAVPTGATPPPPEQKTLTTNGRRTRAGQTSASRLATPPPPASTSRSLLIGGAVGLLLVAAGGGAFLALRPHEPQVEPQPLAPHVVQAEPAPSANVTVRVDSEPAGAQLFDGTSLLGTTPAQLVLPRSRGALNLTVKLAGFQAQTQGVDLAGSDKAVDLHVKLAAEAAPESPAAARADDGKKGQAAKKHDHKVDVPVFE